MKRTAQIGTVRRVASTRMPTRWGMFRALGFERDILNGVHRVETALALVLGDVTAGVPLVRIHSQCFTSEMLGSLRCDCRDQLEMAMQAIAEEGRGLLIYEHQRAVASACRRSCRLTRCRTVVWIRLKQIMHWGSKLIAAISVCRPRSCITWASVGSGFSRIIATKPARWLIPASRSWSKFLAKPRQRRTPLLTCEPKRKKWGTH